MAARCESVEVSVPAEPFAVTINTMKRKHLRAIMKIETTVYTQPWSSTLFTSEMSLAANRAYMVAEAGERVVGYTGLMFVGDDAHVTNLAVDPSWQQHQIGTRLMVQNMRNARNRDAKHVTLEVRMSNEAAQKLYRKFGFAPAGVRKNYYPEDKEDALVMWASDIHRDEYLERLNRVESEIRGETVISLRGEQ